MIVFRYEIINFTIIHLLWLSLNIEWNLNSINIYIVGMKGQGAHIYIYISGQGPNLRTLK